MQGSGKLEKGGNMLEGHWNDGSLTGTAISIDETGVKQELFYRNGRKKKYKTPEYYQPSQDNGYLNMFITAGAIGCFYESCISLQREGPE